MERLISDMMDFTRGQLGGGIPISRSHCNATELCRQAIDECQAAQPGHEVQMASAGTDFNGDWDCDRVLQAMSNLVSNSIKYSSWDPVKVAVSDHGGSVVIDVSNYGAPIPAELQRNIFEPFRRGDDSHGGLGLGLYIVREIVRAHDGVVTVSSTSDGDTTFTVRLPRRGGHVARVSTQ
jgi:signal transduction histidine kinase